MIILIKKNMISENNNIDIASQKIENDIIYNINFTFTIQDEKKIIDVIL